MIVKCGAKTCKYYRNNICCADEIEMKDFDWYCDDINDYVDEMKCTTYENDRDWTYRK